MADFLLLLYSIPSFDRSLSAEVNLDWSVRAENVDRKLFAGINSFYTSQGMNWHGSSVGAKYGVKIDFRAQPSVHALPVLQKLFLFKEEHPDNEQTLSWKKITLLWSKNPDKVYPQVLTSPTLPCPWCPRTEPLVVVATVCSKVTSPGQLSAPLQHKGPQQPLHGHQQSHRIQLQLWQPRNVLS